MKPSQPTHAQYCHEQARIARIDADAATLANVRDRCLRSAEVWEDLAARSDRVTAERRVRDAATARRMGRG
ncbi:hypothetical protein [Sphingomonas sp. LaA6.9]|uniref:hypothetical protein n=1 Tax=Sphingomonas sp. LaA6.9 TaxID=2919914 RepID=UPI001F4F6891|nr:hypothetical protein [Sphingomonas sp. LaA6.9]MCJ8156691.1 hypothetical protein [Sphingomonas sp. LaA6.9]